MVENSTCGLWGVGGIISMIWNIRIPPKLLEILDLIWSPEHYKDASEIPDVLGNIAGAFSEIPPKREEEEK